ncbi:hypothetical protein niasHT_026599 [Heterodera trifolii]|uniref:G-protein coupled receptors family 1 profile domain-containing protein n=1 Tax=Heterodera trifolii TaxID=157864 RepID=A0ABD2KSA2_9BILA
MEETQMKKEAQFTPEIFAGTMPIYAIGFGIVTMFGMLFNFSVIFITFRTKAFRGSVNILLAFYSLCEIVNLCGNFVTIFSAFSGQYFVPFKTAVYFVVIPLTSSGCALNLMVFTGIERSFVVLFPLK